MCRGKISGSFLVRRGMTYDNVRHPDGSHTYSYVGADGKEYRETTHIGGTWERREIGTRTTVASVSTPQGSATVITRGPALVGPRQGGTWK